MRFDLFEWECPDCEAITNGTEPPTLCYCGQGLIIRNLTAEECPTDHDTEQEADCEATDSGRARFDGACGT